MPDLIRPSVLDAAAAIVQVHGPERTRDRIAAALRGYAASIPVDAPDQRTAPASSNGEDTP